jgi:hypothetical protein
MGVQKSTTLSAHKRVSRLCTASLGLLVDSVLVWTRLLGYRDRLRAVVHKEQHSHYMAIAEFMLRILEKGLHVRLQFGYSTRFQISPSALPLKSPDSKEQD